MGCPQFQGGATSSLTLGATRYLKATHCDLFFADGAVFVEGPAERILVPHFVRERHKYEYLRRCYITWLEIGGSHAHRLRKLVEHLGLNTLIITDLTLRRSGVKFCKPVVGAAGGVDEEFESKGKGVELGLDAEAFEFEGGNDGHEDMVALGSLGLGG